MSFSKEKALDPVISISELTLNLISARPGVFGEAIELFSDLRAWLLTIVTEEFHQEARLRRNNADIDVALFVQMKLPSASCPVTISLKLLEAACVILSVWKDEYRDSPPETRTAIDDLVDDLLKDSSDEESETGLASATVTSEGGHVPIESVSRFALSRRT